MLVTRRDLRLHPPRVEPTADVVERLAGLAATSRRAPRGGRLALVVSACLATIALTVGAAWAGGVLQLPGLPSQGPARQATPGDSAVPSPPRSGRERPTGDSVTRERGRALSDREPAAPGARPSAGTPAAGTPLADTPPDTSGSLKARPDPGSENQGKGSDGDTPNPGRQNQGKGKGSDGDPPNPGSQNQGKGPQKEAAGNGGSPEANSGSTANGKGKGNGKGVTSPPGQDQPGVAGGSDGVG